MKNSNYKSFDELPLMLSVPELAALLGISRAGAYELVKEPEFPSLMIGSRIIIPRDKLIKWIDEKSSAVE
jgi:excisionase family DNA binding protein